MFTLAGAQALVDLCGVDPAMTGEIVAAEDLQAGRELYAFTPVAHYAEPFATTSNGAYVAAGFACHLLAYLSRSTVPSQVRPNTRVPTEHIPSFERSVP